MNTTHKLEKITFNMPTEIKEKLMVIKSEIGISLSSIYNEAILEYINKQELARWDRGVNMALQDTAYLEQAKELECDDGGLYEY